MGAVSLFTTKLKDLRQRKHIEDDSVEDVVSTTIRYQDMSLLKCYKPEGAFQKMNNLSVELGYQSWCDICVR